MKNWRKLLALFLCLVICLSLIPTRALAEETELVLDELTEEYCADDQTEEAEYLEPDIQDTTALNYSLLSETEETIAPETVEAVSAESSESEEVPPEEAVSEIDETGMNQVELFTTTVTAEEEQDVESASFAEESAEESAVLPDPAEFETEQEQELTADEERELTATRDSGFCGPEGKFTSVRWELDESGTLTISGSGPMRDYTDPEYAYITSNQPQWDIYPTEIIEIIINPGVTSVGNYAFYGCRAAMKV